VNSSSPKNDRTHYKTKFSLIDLHESFNKVHNNLSF